MIDVINFQPDSKAESIRNQNKQMMVYLAIIITRPNLQYVIYVLKDVTLPCAPVSLGDRLLFPQHIYNTRVFNCSFPEPEGQHY